MASDMAAVVVAVPMRVKGLAEVVYAAEVAMALAEGKWAALEGLGVFVEVGTMVEMRLLWCQSERLGQARYLGPASQQKSGFRQGLGTSCRHETGS